MAATSKSTGTRGSPPVPAGAAFALGMLAVELERWDGAHGDLLVVHIWTDVRPLRGAAGLLDWRLCGRLSSLIQSGRLTGAEGEQLLLPLGGRLPWAAAMVMGLGGRTDFSTGRFRTAVRRAFAAAHGLGARNLGLALPGRDVDAVSLRRAAELLSAELRAAPPSGVVSLTLIEPREGHKDLGAALSAAARAR